MDEYERLSQEEELRAYNEEMLEEQELLKAEEEMIEEWYGDEQ